MLGRILSGLILVLALAVAGLWWAHRDLSPAAVEADYLAPDDAYVEAAGLRARVRIDGPEDAPVL
ncbi:MAG: hypothetical protein PVI23_15285, partial [Maricaulaceae bacterium]